MIALTSCSRNSLSKSRSAMIEDKLNALVARARTRTGKHSLKLDAVSRLSPTKRRRVTKKNKKSVRFAEENNTIRTRHVSNDDLLNAWLQSHDYDQIKLNNRTSLLTLQSTNGDISNLDINTVCVRGLEKLISVYLFNGNHLSQQKHAKHILMQQQVEKSLGISDPDGLRSLSVALSKADRARAVTIAKIDASC